MRLNVQLLHFCDITLNDVKYYVSSRSFQRKRYKLEVIKFVITKTFKSFIFSNKHQNIKRVRCYCNLVDGNCPEYGM